MNNISLTIAVCTINPEQCLVFLRSMMNYLEQNDQVLVIVDGQQYIQPDGEIIAYCKTHQIQLVINTKNSGLSSCRNQAMKMSLNNYLVFFDDDTKLINNTLQRYRSHFSKGKTIGGARLVFPDEFTQYMKWLPKNYSYLFGVHGDEQKIWGACFGFQLDLAIKNGLSFDQVLGRKNRQLQSGDDTLFVRQFREKNDDSFFIDDPVIHGFDKSRFSIRYVVRRTFWQGRSEIRRNNFKEGLIKEIRRSKGGSQSMVKIINGKLLLLVFLVGCLWEKTFLKKQ